MTPLADLASVDGIFGDVVRDLARPGAHLWVRGPVGSGHRTLARRLADEHGAALVELLPESEADAAAHGLLQAAHAAGATLDPSAPIEEMVSGIAAALTRDRRALVLCMSGLSASAAGLATLQPRLAGFVSAWLRRRDLSVVVIGQRPRYIEVTSLERHDLRAAEARCDALLDEARWGGYADAARALHAVLGAASLRPNPLKLRLAVGAVGLGEPPPAVANLLLRGDLLLPVMERIAWHLSNVSSLHSAARRLLLVRAPVPPEVLTQAVRPPLEHAALFTSCLAYGDELVRVSDAVKQSLGAALDKEKDERPDLDRLSVHRVLADHHEANDGVADPAQANSASIVHWLEKVHHLAHGGSDTQARWEAQRVVLRELLWDRARALSMEERDYVRAADVYERCVKAFPDDAYAWHYLGYNLDKAGLGRKRALEAYREAVRLDPQNPWWNGRLVSFLVDQARYQDAERAWSDATAAIDPTGERVAEDPELAANLHVWVAKAWLDAGELSRARRVFDLIPAAARGLRKIPELELRLMDAEETRALGDSVRPWDLGSEDRWRPVALTPHIGRVPLSAWYPGRVCAIERGKVALVVAVPAEDAADRCLFRMELTRREWERLCALPPESLLGRYVEIGEYGKRRALAPLEQRPRRAPIGPDALRYLRPWASS